MSDEVKFFGIGAIVFLVFLGLVAGTSLYEKKLENETYLRCIEHHSPVECHKIP